MSKKVQKGRQTRAGSLAILALLEEDQYVDEEGKDGPWTAARIAGELDVKAATVLHHLERMRRWTQVESRPIKKHVEFWRKGDDPKTMPPRRIEVRTLAWRITERGTGRLKFKGGHDKLCVACRADRPKKVVTNKVKE